MYFKALTITIMGALLVAASDQPVFGELDGDSPVIGVTIDGQPLRLELAPDAPHNPFLNPEVARRIGLEGGLFAAAARIGPHKIKGETNVVKIAVGAAKPQKRRIGFFEGKASAIADGTASPALLDQAVVTYRLAPTAPGERIITLPLSEGGRGGYFVQMKLGEIAIPAYFSLNRAHTVLSAASGAAIAEAMGGRMVGEAGDETIKFGVKRPVRTLEFARQPSLGGLRLRSVVVRTRDYGSVGGIEDADADPSEIVVTGKSKVKPFHLIYIGRDSLAGCSTLTFDRAAAEVRLSCRAE